MVCPGPLGSSGSCFICSRCVSVAVPVNTALLLFAMCIVPMLARMAMGTLAGRQSFSNSLISLLYMVQCCVATEGPQGLFWRGFPYFLLFHFP